MIGKDKLTIGRNVRLVCTDVFDESSLIAKDFDLRQTYNAVVTQMSNGELGYRLTGKVGTRNWLWSAEQPVAKKIWFKVRINLVDGDFE